MTTTHEPINWTAGDDWQINATLLDENGQPFDLSVSEVKWALMNGNWQRAIDEDDVTIVITNALAGQCSINIPAEKTSPLAQGLYLDVIRIVNGGITSTLSYGPINVAPDPWIAAEVVPAVRATTTKQLRVCA